MSDTPDRQHYNVTFARPRGRRRWRSRCCSRWSRRRCRRSSATCTRRRRGVTWVLTAYLLSASVVDADRRPARRHVRQGAHARRACWSCSPSGTLVAALATTIAVLIVGRVIQGVGGGDVPAGVRDHPRRVPARARRRRHRADLGDPRHRRRARASCSPARSSTSSPTTGCSGSRSSSSSSRPSRPSSFVPESPIKAPGRVNWLGAALLCRLAGRAAGRRQPGAELGLGRRPHARPVRRRPRSLLAVVGRGRAARRRAAGRHAR